jgi:hypothetical protein
MSIEAYPLHWPPHRPRTKAADRRRASFHRIEKESYKRGDGTMGTWNRAKDVTVAVGRERLLSEIRAFTKTGRPWVINPDKVIISSNVPTRLDGLPYSNAREPEDPGMAVYFTMNGQQHCLSCDKWDRVADNLNAIAKNVEAMRGQLRWGVADVAQMFAGFKALPGAIIMPAAMSENEAAEFIRTHGGAWHNPETFDQAYRNAAKKFHPDANDGKHLPQWDTLQQAAQALRHHGTTS